MQLQKGGNAPLPASSVALAINFDRQPTGFDVDLIGYLLASNGKVSGDEDMVFFNQPARADGSVKLDVATRTFTVATNLIPAHIDRIAICAVADKGSPSSLEAITATVTGGPSYRHETAGQPEQAIIIAEIYRRNGDWKLRAIGQGFAGGLDPLARSFGIDVAADPAPAPASTPPASPPVDLRKEAFERKMVSLEKTDAKLVSLAKTARVSLEKVGAAKRPAKFRFVLDVSGSMQHHFRSGAVDRLIQRAMGYALNLDDDGDVEITLFDSRAKPHDTADVSNYKSIASNIMRRRDIWGTTNYGEAIQLARHQASSEPDFGQVPVFVMFITDGATSDRTFAANQLRAASEEAIFWKFMAIGPDDSREFEFLRKLDDLKGRKIDNAHFFSVENPDGPTNEQFYKLMSEEYGSWLNAAVAAGILSA